MGRVTGIGGVFFRSRDTAATRDWYRDHLGIESDEYGANFRWRELDDPEHVGHTVWGPFSADTEYFGPKGAEFMVNYRVEDLAGLLKALAAQGVEIAGDVEELEYGRFAWIVDCDGRRVELWEPIGEEVFDQP